MTNFNEFQSLILFSFFWLYYYYFLIFFLVCKDFDWKLDPCSCCSVAKSCPTLCNPMDCSIPHFPVLHYLPEFCSNSCPLSRWCHPTISSSVTPFSYSQFFWALGSFLMSKLFASGGQGIGTYPTYICFQMFIFQVLTQ